MVPPWEWTDQDWIAVGTVVAAIGGVAVAILAIWGEPLRAWIFNAHLVLSITMTEPDCVQIQTVVTGIVNSPAGPVLQQTTTDSYYFRLLVDNDRRAAARQVEVRLTALRVKQPNGTFQADATFHPLSLIWANSFDPGSGRGLVRIPKIDENVPRHCDLCHVIRGATPLLMEFDTETVPNQIGRAQPTRRKRGTFEVDVVATADNALPLRRTLEIRYAGRWYMTPSVMFDKGLKIVIK